MAKKPTPKPTIDDLRALAGGNYFRTGAQFDDNAVETLFDSIKTQWGKGKPLTRDIRAPRAHGALNFHYSFLCIQLKPTKPPFLPKLDLKEKSYGFVLLIEVNGVVAIFKRGVSGFDDWIESECDSIEKRALTRAFSNNAIYEKVSLRRMTVSRSELQGCSYEASDLATTIPVLGLGRSIPRFIRLSHPAAGTVSLTPATSRIHKSGGRLTVDQLAKEVADAVASLAAPAAAGFLDAFPVPEDLSSLPAAVQPTGILFELPNLGCNGDDNAPHFVLRRNGGPDHEYTDLTRMRFASVLALTANGGNWTFKAPRRPKGSIQKAAKTISIDLDTDLETILIDNAGEEEPLVAWIKRNKAYSINFDSPEWFFTQGQLYKRSDFQNNIQLVASALSPNQGLAGIVNEKGKWKAYDQNTTRFEVGSIFRFVEDDFCHNDAHLLCGDLNDEWADYVALSTPINGAGCIRLIHCKAGDETSGASAFQEVIGQATKNLGRVQVSPTILVGKIQELMAKGNWKANVPIPRYQGAGNPGQAATALSANLTKQGYRENREVIAVLTATQKSKKEAALITQGLTGMESALSSWLTPEARQLIRRSIATVQPWLTGNPDPDTAFIWSNGQTRLWREFVGRWPVGEPVKRISIISPFWSQDASLTLATFLTELKKVGPLAPDAEVRLLTDAFKNPNGELIPVLPAAYATQDWQALGVKATAQPVNPEVHPEELGGMEGFTATRALHAKVVLVEGTRSGLAYLGSGNFTGHGWGFIPGADNANTEAGVILRRSLQSSDFDHVLPDLVGQPILLSHANIHNLQAPEMGPADEPWPEFIRQVLLAPVTADENKLELRIETAADGAGFLWSARLLAKDGVPGETLVPLEQTQDATKTSFTVSLSDLVLTRLLTDQEIQICWPDCPAGRPFPLNVEASARASLPISPGKQTIEEIHLISYYQGRIAWEQLFPDPEAGGPSGDQTAITPAPASGVDKSRIQSYQIREFVEALAGLNQDLRSATQSEPAMRLALLGPVSPFALAQTIIDAVEAGRRTPTAAGFQLVEILACLQSARSHSVPERLADVWQQHLQQVHGKISRLLEKLIADHPDLFASNRSFGRYRKAVLNGETMLPS